MGLGNWRRQLDTLTHPQTIPIAEVMKYQYQKPEKRKS